MDDLNLLEAMGVGVILLITIWAATKWEIAGTALLCGTWLVAWAITIATIVVLLVATFTH